MLTLSLLPLLIAAAPQNFPRQAAPGPVNVSIPRAPAIPRSTVPGRTPQQRGVVVQQLTGSPAPSMGPTIRLGGPGAPPPGNNLDYYRVFTIAHPANGAFMLENGYILMRVSQTGRYLFECAVSSSQSLRWYGSAKSGGTIGGTTPVIGGDAAFIVDTAAITYNQIYLANAAATPWGFVFCDVTRIGP